MAIRVGDGVGLGLQILGVNMGIYRHPRSLVDPVRSYRGSHFKRSCWPPGPG